MKLLGLVGRYHFWEGVKQLRLSFLFDKAKKKEKTENHYSSTSASCLFRRSANTYHLGTLVIT